MIDSRELNRMADAAKKHGSAGVTGPHVRGGTIQRECPCVKCRYNLRGVHFGGKCPECGTPVDRSIDPESPDFVPFRDWTGWRPDWWIRFLGSSKQNESTAKKPPPTVTKPLCKRCGYDLSGTPQGRPCPECGTGQARGRAGAIAAIEARDALARHATSGLLIALGWGLTGGALLVQWLVFSIEVAFADMPWAMTGLVAYGLSAIGSGATTLAVVRLLLQDPPGDVRQETTFATRLTGIFGVGLWCLTSLAVAYACWAGLSTGHVAMIHAGYVVSSILLGFYCRVMYVIAAMLSRSERSMQTATIGFSITMFFLVGSVWWFSSIGRIPLISFVSVMFVSIFCGVFVYRFFRSNIDVGLGIWWAGKTLYDLEDRDQRKREQWEARARADREHERKHGNSAGL